MKLRNFISVALSGLITLSLTGCLGGGGGGSSSTGGSYYTHAELAEEFVRRVYTDLGYDLELVKTNTEQYDYIVVYDWDLGTYDAYYLGSYNVGEDLFDYMLDYDYLFYYDLIDLGGNLYEDYDTGLIFEKTATTQYDEEKVAALKQVIGIKKAANNIVSSYGLPEDRALELAKLSAQLKFADQRSLTDEDYKSIAVEAFGVDPLEYVKAYQAKVTTGNTAQLDALIEKSAEKNRTTPENINKIIDKIALDMVGSN